MAALLDRNQKTVSAERAAVQSGSAKPNLRLEYLDAGDRKPFQELYNLGLEELNSFQGKEPSLWAVSDFLHYHDRYEERCLRPEEPTRKYVQTGTRFVGTDYVSTDYYEVYNAIEVEIRTYAFSRYSDLGSSFSERLTAKALAASRDGANNSFPEFMSFYAQEIERRALAIDTIIANEGCRTPTLEKLQTRIDGSVGVFK